MGSAVSRKANPEVKSYTFKCVTYCSNRNNIVVVYGRGRKPADCIVTEQVPGARVDFTGSTDTICIIKQRAVIRCSGVIRMDKNEALLRLEEGAGINVGINGRLIIDGMLILEKNSRLVVEPGSCLVVREAMNISNGVTLTVSDCCYDLWMHAVFSVSSTLNSDDYSADRGKMVTWSEKDKLLLVGLMHFFCNDHRLPAELIYPVLLPTICRRYGVLMSPKPYRMGKGVFEK